MIVDERMASFINSFATPNSEFSDEIEKYFDILHHPYEENGVDFWWID